MIKTMEFGEKKVSFSTSFAWTFIYKSQFGRDAAKVLLPVVKKSLSGDIAADDYGYLFFEELGFTGVVELAWSMARVLDKNISGPVEWVASLGDDFVPLDIVLELIPDAIESCFASKKVSAPTKATTKAPKKSK